MFFSVNNLCMNNFYDQKYKKMVFIWKISNVCWIRPIPFLFCFQDSLCLESKHGVNRSKLIQIAYEADIDEDGYIDR